eukprot:gene69-99_t
MKQFIIEHGLPTFANSCHELYTVSENTYGQNKLIQKAIGVYVYTNRLIDSLTHRVFLSADYSTDSPEKLLVLGAIVRSTFENTDHSLERIDRYPFSTNMQKLHEATLQDEITNVVILKELDNMTTNVNYFADQAKLAFVMGGRSQQDAAALRLLNKKNFEKRDFQVIQNYFPNTNPRYNELDLMNDARSDSLSRQACCFATSSRWTATIFDIQALMARPVNEALIRQGHFEHFKREFDKQSNTDHWYLGKVAVSVDATECVEFLITRDLGFLRSRELFQYAAEQGSVQCLDCLYKQLWNDPCSKMSVSNMKRLLEMALFFAIKSDRCDATGFILKKLM